MHRKREDQSGMEWLLFLGAGASVSKPASLPAFPALATGVLRGIGWCPTADRKRWTHPRYPDFRTPALASEVLFGTLRLSGISFAEEVAEVLSDAEPNALHAAAAAVLERGGLVWTTNVDCCVERACATVPHRAGRVGLDRLGSARAGTLVKFHGSVESPETLAFTDRELIAPLARVEVEHLVDLAGERVVVLYGYAGADADLFELLEELFRRARDVVWFEPRIRQRHEIRRAFPEAQLRFLPGDPPNDFGAAVATTGRAFLTLAREAGITIEAQLARELENPGDPPAVRLRLRQPPGVTHARLVERFGDYGDDQLALALARRRDVRELRLDALRGHLRWVRNNSLYRDGILSRVVDGLAGHRTLLHVLRPRRLQHYMITAEHALLLQRRDLHAIDEFATWAIEHRAGGAIPTDLYYRAQARRYDLHVREGLKDAEQARAGLSAAQDPERHAGALLESGCLSLYAGRFDRTARAAFELRFRTGRYAIPRWQAWGAWLEAIVLCHMRRPAEARAAASAAEERFRDEQRPGPIADVATARLLAARAERALGEKPDIETSLEDARELGGRYLDDRRLILADHLLADENIDGAERLLGAVAENPSCAVAKAWAQLGLAEIARLGGRDDAAVAFRALAGLARARGAHWLQAQAAIGLALCGEDGWSGVPEPVREAAGELGFGEPRVLWMMTA
jgi:hypothetical protein